MHRTSAIALLLALALGLAGCSKEPPPAGAAAQRTAEPVATPADAPARPLGPSTPATARLALAETSSYEAIFTQVSGAEGGASASPHEAILFFDPSAPASAQAWASAQHIAKRTRILWVPVAPQGGASLAVGAQLLGDRTPGALLRWHFNEISQQRTGIPERHGERLASAQAVERNSAVLRMLATTGELPHLVVRDAQAPGRMRSHTGVLDPGWMMRFIGVRPE